MSEELLEREDVPGGRESTTPRILAADDQPDVLEALELLLGNEGYSLKTVTSPEAVLRALEAEEFDAVLIDLNYARDTTSGREGLDLLGRIRAIDHTLPVVVMTAWSTVPLVVEALRRGVRDFVEKPWENARLLETLQEQIGLARAQRRYRRREALELEDAQSTERLLLPKEIPQVPGYQLAGAWLPASLVGGDYFDARELASDTLALGIGDVSGKGIAAALLMSNLQAAVKASASESVGPAALAARVNRVISGNMAAHKFVTFFYALLHTSERKLVYSNAGHNAPVLVRQDGACVPLSAGGPVLGWSADSPYEQATVDLAPGDTLVLFTDGISEARNESGEEFGEERLIRLVVENRTLDAEALKTKLLDSALVYSGHSFEDDATLVVLKVG